MANEKRWEWDESGKDTVLEVTGEYTLPEYLPEVKRVLRVDLCLFPDGQYTRDGMVACGGRIRYYILYTAKDGSLSCGMVEGEYTGEVPEKEGAETLVMVKGEGASCRPLGPRRLSMKANISLHPLSHSQGEMQESLPQEAGEMELLKTTFPSSHTTYFHSGDIPLTTTIHTDSGTEVLTLEGRVLPRSCMCENGGVKARGEVFISFLTHGDDGMPHGQKVKIPFEEYIPLEGVTPESKCLLYGNLREISGMPCETDGGNGMVLDCVLSLYGMVVENGSCECISDLYSLTYPMEVTTAKASSRYYPAILSGCFTIEGSTDRGSMECREADAVLQARGDVISEGCHFENGEAVIEGEIRVGGIANGEEGYLPLSFVMPYKLRFALGEEVPMDSTLIPRVSCVNTTAHFEGERVTGVCEVYATLAAERSTETPYVEEAVVAGEAYPKTDTVKAVYLADGDSLWSVAKRYHTPLLEVMENNSLPQEILATPSASYLLDGLTRLVID